MPRRLKVTLRLKSKVSLLSFAKLRFTKLDTELAVNLGRVFASHILSVCKLSKAFGQVFFLVLVFLLALHLKQIRALIIRNKSKGLGFVQHKYCFVGIVNTNSADEVVFFR
jgi:hypothetical protein